MLISDSRMRAVQHPPGTSKKDVSHRWLNGHQRFREGVVPMWIGQRSLTLQMQVYKGENTRRLEQIKQERDHVPLETTGTWKRRHSIAQAGIQQSTICPAQHIDT